MKDASNTNQTNKKEVKIMFIAIEHEIHDPELFQECAEDVFPLPEDLHVHQFFPAKDMSRATCLYEAPSVEQLSNYLDGKLRQASTQQYFPVNEEPAIGLPEGLQKQRRSKAKQ